LISAELAEVLGVLLGDGCICRYYARGGFRFLTAFTASPSEYWYYDQFIRPTIVKNFGVTGYLYLRKDNTTRYHIESEKLATALIHLGIPVGKKYDASIPPEVIASGHVISFIRGVYHAEGSIYRRYSKRYNTHVRVYDNLLNIQLRMKLATLMRQIHESLIAMGIECNRLTNKEGVYTFRITKQEMVRKFLEIIKPRYKSSPRRANL
jgi:intein/homing endonuclease